MTTRANTQSVMNREDIAALAMNAIELDTHLTERRNQIVTLSNKSDDLSKAIDAINNISGRASVGHDKDCECGYCVIHRIAFRVWTNS